MTIVVTVAIILIIFFVLCVATARRQTLQGVSLSPAGSIVPGSTKPDTSKLKKVIVPTTPAILATGKLIKSYNSTFYSVYSHTCREKDRVTALYTNVDSAIMACAADSDKCGAVGFSSNGHFFGATTAVANSLLPTTMVSLGRPWCYISTDIMPMKIIPSKTTTYSIVLDKNVHVRSNAKYYKTQQYISQPIYDADTTFLDHTQKNYAVTVKPNFYIDTIKDPNFPGKVTLKGDNGWVESAVDITSPPVDISVSELIYGEEGYVTIIVYDVYFQLVRQVVLKISDQSVFGDKLHQQGLLIGPFTQVWYLNTKKVIAELRNAPEDRVIFSDLVFQDLRFWVDGTKSIIYNYDDLVRVPNVVDYTL